MNRSILDGTPHDGLARSRRADRAGEAPVGAFASRPAVAVTPDTDFATMVAAITASRRGVLPVVATDESVLGVVAASDLLAAYGAEEEATDEPTAIVARDLMTVPAVTVAEDRSVREAVRIVLSAAIHHLPVVDADGRLVGILSPHDLLEALRRADEAIRDEALALALTPGSGVVPSALRVTCERGVVQLSGRTRTREDAAALCLAVSGIDGVVGLTDQLRWDSADGTRGPTA